MKKTLYMLLLAIIGVISFASCGDDNDGDKTFDQSAAQAAAGIYDGTYSYVSDAGTTLTEQGTMIISVQSDYVGMFSFLCPTLGVNHESIANVCHSNDGFAFSNNLKTNGLGNAFLGRIDDAQNVEAHLNMVLVGGTKTYSVIFTGHKRQ